MLTIDLPLPGTAVAFSTKRGPEANSSNPYSGFNACHYTGDSPEHVAASRAELSRFLGLPQEHIIIPRQNHSDRVAIIDRLPVNPEAIENVDALVTALPGIALCINTADCVPVLLSDPEASVTAAAHCGWRGIVNHLLPNVIEAMVHLGADPLHIHAAMGPSICTKCFEVGPEVADRFRHTFPQASGIVIDGGPKPHINLGAAVAERLRMLGLPLSNISRPRDCSRCNPSTYFSARALGISSGRTLTLIHRP